jgi:integrase
MARTVRDARIESREARRKLPPSSQQYWRAISQGAHIGYYKGPTAGSWYARCRSKDSYIKKMIGKADDNQDADGVTVLSFSQAQEKARAWIQAIEQQAAGHTPSKLITVAYAAERYLEWFKEHRKGYKETLLAINAHILPALGHDLVNELTSKQIREWLQELATTPARKRSKLGKKQAYQDKPKTEDEKRARRASANRTFAILKALLNKAFQDELVTDDLAWRRVKPFAKVDEPVIRFLTQADSLRLLNSCRPDFRELVRAALFTGARYSELTNLQARDFNADTRLIHIREAKSGRGRHIPLSGEGFDFFKAVNTGRTGEQKIFQKENGVAWGRNHHIRLLEAACKNARIEPMIGFHELRHTYASLLAQAGTHLLTISKLLGHSDTRITSRHYAHLCDKSLADAVEANLPSFGYKPENKIKAIR